MTNQFSILALDIEHINAYINDQSRNKPAFTTVTLPLHSTVNQKLKEKIWANEYVELSTVLNDDIRLTSKISDFPRFRARVNNLTQCYFPKIINFILYFTVKTNVYQNLIKLVFSLI